jgi:hypothetical protein
MKEREGIIRSLPGSSSQSRCSKHCKTHFRNVEAEGSNPFTSTIYFGGPRRKPTISWAFVLFQRISTDLSTGLSTEYVDGLSKLPY